MRTPHIVTVIAEIIPEKREDLRTLLRDKIDPKIRKDGRLITKGNLLDFASLSDLHLCSFFILDGEVGKPDLLVFEATMDNAPREFLENLVELSPGAIDKIYAHCKGYPGDAERFSRSVVDYLMLRRVADNTYYCGYPGRTVGQIRSENHLRTNIRNYVDKKLAGKELLPATYSAIHRKVKAVVRANESLRWAEAAVEPPVAVRWKRPILAILLFALVAVFYGVFYVLNYGMLGDPLGLTNFSKLAGEYMVNLSVLNETHLNAGASGWPELLAAIVTSSLFLAIASAAGLWFVLRLFKHVIDERDAKYATFWNRFSVSIIALAAGSIFVIALFLGTKFSWDLMVDRGYIAGGYSGWWLVLVAFVTAVGLAILSMIDSKTVKSVELGRAVHDGNMFRLATADLFSLFRRLLWIAYWLAVIGALHSFFSWICWIDFQLPLSEHHSEKIAFIGAAITHISIFLIGLVALIFVLLMIFRILEAFDARANIDADVLARKVRFYDEKTAREEVGTNTNQNHLISMVHVKPGWLRQQILRFILLLIDVVAHFSQNEGELGQIPTILSARWTLIDGGKRMIFMTNYGGAFDSYINEFLDLNGVRGVNAIWTNTLTPNPDDKNGKSFIRFPLTKFLMWRGAENERQFKEYIRSSQVETLAWYSAYPDLVVTNINNNTHIRNALFKDLNTQQLDDLAGRI